MPPKLPILAVFVALVLASPLRAGDYVVVPAALSGDSAPGGERGFVSFSQGRLNDLGQIAFAGRTEVGTAADFLGVWFGRPGALTSVARMGDHSPQGESLFASGAGLLRLNNFGQLALSMDHRLPGAAARAALWVGRPGRLALVAEAGTAAPDDDGLESPLRFFSFNSLSFADAGGLAFEAEVFAGERRSGLWAGSPGSLRRVALAGAPAPGSNQRLFGRFGPPLIDDRGSVAFRAEVTPRGYGDSAGVWTWDAGFLTPVTITGYQAAGFPEGSPLSRLAALGQNAAGTRVFQGSVGGGGAAAQGIWMQAAGFPLVLAIRSGDPAPGGELRHYGALTGALSLSARGEIAFLAALTDQTTGLVAGPPDWPRLVARSGQSAPGLTAARFDAFLSFRQGAGGVAFAATAEAAGQPIAAGLWASGENAPLPVALVGEPIAGTAFAESRPLAINNAGQILFSATLRDGRKGLFLASRRDGLLARAQDLAEAARLLDNIAAARRLGRLLKRLIRALENNEIAAAREHLAETRETAGKIRTLPGTLRRDLAELAAYLGPPAE